MWPTSTRRFYGRLARERREAAGGGGRDDQAPYADRATLFQLAICVAIFGWYALFNLLHSIDQQRRSAAIVWRHIHSLYLLKLKVNQSSRLLAPLATGHSRQSGLIFSLPPSILPSSFEDTTALHENQANHCRQCPGRHRPHSPVPGRRGPPSFRSKTASSMSSKKLVAAYQRPTSSSTICRCCWRAHLSYLESIRRPPSNQRDAHHSPCHALPESPTITTRTRHYTTCHYPHATTFSHRRWCYYQC